MIEGLIKWYRANCDGDWEHQLGFTIETTDNPGISLTVDIGKNPELNPAEDRIIQTEFGTRSASKHGCELRVRGGQLVGYADPGEASRLFSEVDSFLQGSDG